MRNNMIQGDKMMSGYRMIKDYAEAVFIEKKSKFISYTKPVLVEEEAIQFLNGIRKKHYDATHNCYAYILGDTGGIQRSSDDGEPSGTAGIPILEVLRKENLTNTIIIVTRYFGGIMLGAGGLIRAYTEGAAGAVKAAGTVLVQPYAVYDLTIDYGFLSKLQYEIPRKQYIIADIQYADTVSMHILTRLEQKEAFPKDIAEWTNGSAACCFSGVEMLKLDETTKTIMNK